MPKQPTKVVTKKAVKKAKRKPAAKAAKNPVAGRAAPKQRASASGPAAKGVAAIPVAVAGKRVTPAAYCWSRFDAMLGAGTTSRDADGRRTYSDQGKAVAVLALEGEELVLDFDPPREDPQFAKVKSLYTPTPGRRGWLRFRRPATRDPRPDLAAKIGPLLGRAKYERKPAAPSFRSIVSGGGPYVCLPASKLSTWLGAADRDEFPEGFALYEQVLKSPDTAAVIPLADGGKAIVLGTPDSLYWFERAGGGVLVRTISFDADADAQLEALLRDLPKPGWNRIGDPIAVTEPYVAFEAAEFGGAIGAGNSLPLNLATGTYVLAARTWAPNAGTELLLVSLDRT